MSRIGRLPITVPAGVTVDVTDDNCVVVKGPKGELSEKVSKDITVKVENGVVTVERHSDDKEHRALHGLYRALINNMVVGVTKGFQKQIEIIGVGYRAAKDGKKLVINAGYSHQVFFEDKDGITYDVPDPNHININGISRQLVGEMAAKVRGVRPPEPYKGKGFKYVDETIRRKEGKTGK